MSNELKFPSGKFTHTELAQHNGKTNQQVWTAYQAAIKDGTIISAGERPNPTGKGKPSKLWEVNLNKGVATTPLTNTPPAVVPTPKIQAEPRVKRQPKPVQVVQPMEAEMTKVVEKKLAVVEPTKAPEVEPEETEVVPRPINVLTSQVEEIEDVCPFCKTKLLMVKGDGRVKVWCRVNDLKVCSCSENPYGVGRTLEAALKVLHEKYFDKK